MFFCVHEFHSSFGNSKCWALWGLLRSFLWKNIETIHDQILFPFNLSYRSKISTVLAWSFPCSKEKTEISICEQRLVVRGKLLEDATLVSSIEGRIFLARAAGAEQPSSPATTEEVEEITLVIKKLGCSLETILTVSHFFGAQHVSHISDSSAKKSYESTIITLFYLCFTWEQDQIT